MRGKATKDLAVIDMQYGCSNNDQGLKRRRRNSMQDMIKNEKANEGQEEEGKTAIQRFMADSDPEGWDNNEDNNNNNNSNNSDLTEDDVYTQLAQRESDLSLAKEIGQALLAENAELREKYDNALDLHRNEVEELKQEGHEYKLKRKQTEIVQDEKIHGLQIELENLQNKLQSIEAASRSEKRSRRENVSDLVEENAKLNSQLTKLSNSNKQLLAEVRRLKKMQQENRPECCCETEREERDALQQKVNILEEKRKQFRASITELEDEKQVFSNEVNRLTHKVIFLTEELADNKSELSLCEEELNSSRKDNVKLHDQLEEIKLQNSQHIALSGSSIFSEISMLENENDFSMRLADSPSCKRLKQVASLHGTPKPLAASSSINLFKPQEQLESVSLDCTSHDSSLEESDDDEIAGKDGGDFVLKQHGFFAQLEDEQKANAEMRKEMFSVSHQLLRACKVVTNKNYETKQTTIMDLEQHFTKDEDVNGTLTMIAAELIGLVKEYVEKHEGEEGEFLISEEELDSLQEKLGILEKQVEDLTTECFEARKQLSSLGIQLDQSRKESCKKDEEIEHLLKKTNDQESEIKSLKNKSRPHRASVIEELERAKSDVKKLDTQLLVAINQKIQLSEQLEQWQYDMASVIEEQVQKQLKNTVNERDNTKRRSSLSKLPFMKKGWNWTT